MGLLLVVINGICWTIVYIEAIRLGFKEKTYAIPFVALALNIAWEILDSTLGFVEFGFHIQVIINAIVAVLDVIIVITFFKFGYKYFAHLVSKKQFFLISVFILAVCFPIQYAFIIEFGLVDGPIYAAYIQNLIMSVLFIDMFFRRKSTEGQSLTIAINKWLGTFAASIHLSFNRNILFVAIFGIIIVIFDVFYIILLYRAKKQ